MNVTWIRWTATAVTLMGLAGAAPAQVTQPSSVLDGMGVRAVGGAFTHIGAGGQPGGIAMSRGGTYYNQAGFLNTFFLKPGLDTDGNGVPDEADGDNDGDGLDDEAEITGSGFSPATATDPNLADTDDDGVGDHEESLAGTDPTDFSALLEIVRLSRGGGGQQVSWLARGDNQKVYVVHALDDIRDGLSTVIFSNTVAGGAAPWYLFTNTLVDAVNPGRQFYAVEVLP